MHLIFDTETTGLPKHPHAKDGVQPSIIEFGGLLVDDRGAIVEELSFLCNPKKKLEPIITKITGLTDDDLEGQPAFNDHLPRLTRFFERADTVAAHNLPFDFNMINLELARLNFIDFPWPARRICTVQEHAESWGKRVKLLDLYEHYTGKPLAQKHRAIDDVMALLEVCKLSGVLL